METLVASASSAAPSRTRLAGWLLALQLIGWVGAIVAGLANFPPSEFDTWTPATFASVQAPWIFFHLFIALAIVVGNSGLALLATRLRTSRARLLGLVTLVCAIGAIALIVVVAALRVSVVGFSAPTLGQVRAYQVSDPLFRSADAITLLATLSAAIGLWQSGLARRTEISHTRDLLVDGRIRLAAALVRHRASRGTDCRPDRTDVDVARTRQFPS